MPSPLRTSAFLSALFLVSSCATVTRLPETELPAPLAGATARFAEQGPASYTVAPGARVGEYGCRVAWETYLPERRVGDTMVMLGHGFMRDLGAMRGWAAHWASHGLAVTVVSFCNSRWTAGNHDRNAADLVALARELHDGPVLYAGFSAGGLAAFLAAASDERAVAYLGLDAVDSGGLGLAASPGFRVPALFLLGEPSSCNAKNNFLPAVPDRADAAALRVRHATHGHFENPYDPAVERVCGRVLPAEASAQVLATVHALATAWVLDRAAGSEEGAAAVAAALAGSGEWRGRVVPQKGAVR